MLSQLLRLQQIPCHRTTQRMYHVGPGHIIEAAATAGFVWLTSCILHESSDLCKRSTQLICGSDADLQLAARQAPHT